MPPELTINALYERYHLPVPPWELDLTDERIAEWMGRTAEINALLRGDSPAPGTLPTAAQQRAEREHRRRVARGEA